MRERPILFSGPMVRAILAGHKMQTRRAVKPPRSWDTQYPHCDPFVMPPAVWWWNGVHDRVGVRQACPYGQPGDRLWVRETWMPDTPRDGTWADTQFFGCGMSPLSDIPELYRKPEHCLYRATWNGVGMVGWKPSIHMPRWASRITLEITGVRVERLKDISEDDAYAEGVKHSEHGGLTARDGFQRLWESINGAESWDKNPWVWVVQFRRIEA
ncbi:hypothetical protein PuT2_14010 [Pusillimonas sp. T2]|uniref:hypothetical protein n=1 Tax=Pusillimonas sp. T2 TaxID=1548123 RepID=UPI000B9C8839|nr:hypothetical protein [Pusillimonas sp. T2]OXR48134.1 hypothetical protein PuT2_14010 [Pusillimonas sp. T2]